MTGLPDIRFIKYTLQFGPERNLTPEPHEVDKLYITLWKQGFTLGLQVNVTHEESKHGGIRIL